MQKTFLIAATFVAGIAAIYFWHELRAERRLTAQLRESESPVTQVQRASPTPDPAPPPVQQATPVTPPQVPNALKNDPEADALAGPNEVPLDFNRLVKESKEASGMHAAFLSQPQDPALAYEMENKWNQYYAGKPDVQQYGKPDIKCGSNLCEIRLLAKGSNSSMKWAQVMFGAGASLYEKPAYDLVSMAMLEEGDNTAMTFLVANRRPAATSGK